MIVEAPIFNNQAPKSFFEVKNPVRRDMEILALLGMVQPLIEEPDEEE